MAIALGGRPDESAKMVCCRGYIAYLPPSSLKRQRNFSYFGQRWLTCGRRRRPHKLLQQNRSILLDLCCGNPPDPQIELATISIL